MSSSPAEYLDSHLIFAPEGDVTVINTTNVSQSEFDLSDPDFLGDKVYDGYPWLLISSVDTWIKFSADGTTNLDNTARSTASAGGGAAQGVFLPAETYVKFFFTKIHAGDILKTIHTQNASATGFICICRAGQDTH